MLMRRGRSVCVCLFGLSEQDCLSRRRRRPPTQPLTSITTRRVDWEDFRCSRAHGRVGLTWPDVLAARVRSGVAGRFSTTPEYGNHISVTYSVGVSASAQTSARSVGHSSDSMIVQQILMGDDPSSIDRTTTTAAAIFATQPYPPSHRCTTAFMHGGLGACALRRFVYASISLLSGHFLSFGLIVRDI